MLRKLKQLYNNIILFELNPLRRTRVVLALTFFLFFLVIAKLVIIYFSHDLNHYRLPLYKNIASDLNLRHDISDRNGNVIAVTVPSRSIYIKPSEVKDPKRANKALVNALHIPSSQAQSILNSKKKFIWLVRNASNQQVKNFLKYGVIGAYIDKGFKRFYPYGNYFSHTLGITDIDGNGISGVEKYFNKKLKSKDIQLSLDIRLQVVLRDNLVKAVKDNHAKGALGIIVNPNNGEVLAISSVPDFDPNNIDSNSLNNMFSYVTKGLFEQGSIFKLFTIAMALNDGYFSIDDRFDLSKPIVVDNHVITDDEYITKSVALPAVLIHSSDIGSALMAMAMGSNVQRSYFSKLGLFSETSIETPEKAASLLPNYWSKLSLITLSYGYGIAVSQAVAANAVASIINGGYYIPFTLLKKQPNQPISKRRVISEQTSAYMRRMARLVVSAGTGVKANVPGYNVGGKTGSAEKINSAGRYSFHNKMFSSLVTFFPAKHPKYLVFVSINEPKRVKANRWNLTASSVAAPFVAKIIRDMASLLGVERQTDDADKVDADNNDQIVKFVKQGHL